MTSEASMIADLANILTEGLDGSFTVLPATFYVAIIHPELGLAAVVPTDNERLAQNAASDLTTKAAMAGIAWPAVHFGISQSRVAPPWLIRAGAGSIVDITTSMKMLSAARPVLGMQGALSVINQLVSIKKAVEEVAIKTTVKPKRALDEKMQRMLKVSIEQVLQDRTAYLAGVEIDADDLASPSFMLPALLVSAGLKWAIPVASKKGQGGFLITMEKDDKAVLGYTVTKINHSAPLLLFVPMVDVIRRSFKNGECIMDEVVQEFSDYLDRNQLDNSELGDMEINAASR
ncbi:hypothetical protein [Mesorhizobium sp. SP-1A]|uniref:hypothetical protein n=1 Tax=Mesorhizobium sp. SP-1A TaxID=3077840 RepID=UPI0028F7449B|nr:hypothetical protein [Mesorhizobium sp. SP-1A]